MGIAFLSNQHTECSLWGVQPGPTQGTSKNIYKEGTVSPTNGVTYQALSPQSHTLKCLVLGIPLFPHPHHVPPLHWPWPKSTVRSRRPGWSASYFISLLRPVPTLAW